MRRKGSNLMLAVVTLVVSLLVVFNAWRDYQVREEIQTFFDAGPRFTLDDGLLLCERIRKIEKEQNISNPVNCDKLEKLRLEEGDKK